MRRVGVGGYLPVPEIPGPADDGALAGCGLVGKLDGRGRTSNLQVGCELGGGEGINRYVVFFYDGGGAAAVLYYQCDRIRPGGTIYHAGILGAGYLSIAKVPGPESWVIGGLIAEMDGQGATAGCCRGCKVGHRHLGTEAEYPKEKANGNCNNLSYPDQKGVNFGH